MYCMQYTQYMHAIYMRLSVRLLLSDRFMLRCCTKAHGELWSACMADKAIVHWLIIGIRTDFKELSNSLSMYKRSWPAIQPLLS